MRAVKAPADPLLTPAEAGVQLNVDPKTVSRWANQRRISHILLPSGHRRFRQSEVDRLLREGSVPASVQVLPAKDDVA